MRRALAARAAEHEAQRRHREDTCRAGLPRRTIVTVVQPGALVVARHVARVAVQEAHVSRTGYQGSHSTIRGSALWVHRGFPRRAGWRAPKAATRSHGQAARHRGAYGQLDR